MNRADHRRCENLSSIQRKESAFQPRKIHLSLKSHFPPLSNPSPPAPSFTCLAACSHFSRICMLRNESAHKLFLLSSCIRNRVWVCLWGLGAYLCLTPALIIKLCQAPSEIRSTGFGNVFYYVRKGEINKKPRFALSML